MTERYIPASLNDTVARMRSALPDEVVDTFERLMRKNLASVITPWDDGTAFVVTGDIPAMWLRDSAAQLRPYLLLCQDDPLLQQDLISILRRQIRFLLTDPYANSFTDGSPSRHATDITDAGPHTRERKFELDSLAFPLELAHRLWKMTGDSGILDEELHQACRVVIDVYERETEHDTRSDYTFARPDSSASDTLVRGGRGRLTEPCGLIWSGFRPSDDACDLGYNIPGNMFASVALECIAALAEEGFQDAPLATHARSLRAAIDQALLEHGTYEHPQFGTVFAYEVDGNGRSVLMDDANMPSLLAAPLTGWIPDDDPLYRNTRRFVLSSSNPLFYAGDDHEGIGSPHTPYGYIWPIALATQGLTATEDSEKQTCLTRLLSTTGGTGDMHESFDLENPAVFTRPWFSWADAMFCELALDLVGIRFQKM